MGEKCQKKPKKVKKYEMSDMGISEAELVSQDVVVNSSKSPGKGDVNKRKAKRIEGNDKKTKRAREENKDNVDKENFNQLGEVEGTPREIMVNEKKKKKEKVVTTDKEGYVRKMEKLNALGEGIGELGGNYNRNVMEKFDGSNSSEKADGKVKKAAVIRGNDKKTKKKRIGRVDNDSNEREKLNELGEEIGEHVGGHHSDGNAIKNVECNYRSRKDKTIWDLGYQLQEKQLEDIEGSAGSNMQGTHGIGIEDVKDVKLRGKGPCGDVVGEHGKKKRKRERNKEKVYSSYSQEASTHFTDNVTQDNESRNIEYANMDEDILDGGKAKQENKIDRLVSGRVTPSTENYKQNDASSKMNDKGDIGTKNKKNKGKRKEAKSVENGFKDPKQGKGKKKVSFSNNIEIFPPTDVPNAGEESTKEALVQGKRFSLEEDEIVKQAVYKYMEAYGLGEDGLDMVLNCRSHPKIKNCWKEIATCLPYRPQAAVYYRAHILFRKSEGRHKWTNDEYEIIRNSQAKHGNQWKLLADELGTHRFHVKDTWRRIRYTNLKKGQWSQGEYQALFDLVNTDLKVKYSEEKKSKHGMLRDNICWTAISDKLSTRSDATCCMKWYNQLTSPMVAEGEWADADDYRLLTALYELDASCPEDVDWDNLLDSRSGNVCRKRWSQMVCHIGYHGIKPFAEQVEVLAMRYCPDLLEARESWDSKPVVP